MRHALMTGWKTWLAGLASIVWGLYQLIDGTQEDGMSHIIEGIAIIGIGHKIDKVSTEVKKADLTAEVPCPDVVDLRHFDDPL